MKNLQIGQRLEVYRVVIDHPAKHIIPIGWCSVGHPDEILSDAVMIYSKRNGLDIRFTMWPDDVKKVGCLVIKIIKRGK